jgi:antirestriction protein ArdC
MARRYGVNDPVTFRILGPRDFRSTCVRARSPPPVHVPPGGEGNFEVRRWRPRHGCSNATSLGRISYSQRVLIMKRDLYAEVSTRIISELEAGAAPWIKPWSATPGANVPCNAVSNRPYSGSNVVLLWMAQAAGFRTPRYLTFKQALELGGHVRKGERGTKIYFVKHLQVRDEDDDTVTHIVPMLRDYTVFNIDQCEKLPERVVAPAAVKPHNSDERSAAIDEFLKCTDASIREGAGEAYYLPGADFISLPRFETFKSAAHFYSTAFHELGHWTGHKSRLARDLRHRFGERAYAAEELVAELCSAFLCAEFSIDGDLRHAGYIQNWIGLLKADTRAFFTACSRAQAAADFLRGLVLAASAEVAA